MAYDNTQSGSDRQMHQGDWKCAGCNGSITELPFKPDPARADQLRCKDCFRNSKNGNGNRQGNSNRQMYQGNWKCSGCGTAITELPFEPDPARADQLKCRNCYKDNKPPRRQF